MFPNVPFSSVKFCNISPFCNYGSILKVKSLPDPYTDCDDSNSVSVSECRLACLTRTVVEKCGCHDVYMSPLYNGTRTYPKVTSKLNNSQCK